MPVPGHRSNLQLRFQPSLPYGVRFFAWVRAIRWVGVGLGGALVPVFILYFATSFGEVGLFSSMFNIAALVSLPIIGAWADKAPAKSLILLALLLYPLVGISYLMAGLLGMAIFVILARAANGFLWELENIGLATYYRRMSAHTQIARSFGYLDTWSRLAWISAAVFGMVVVPYVPVHWLLFGIAPFAILAYIVALKAPGDRVGHGVQEKLWIASSYSKSIAELRAWNAHMWLLGVLMLFSGIIGSLIRLFLPVVAYINGANLPMVILISAFGVAPALCGYKLGVMADAHNKYGLISVGLLILALIQLVLAVFPQYLFKLVAVFIMGFILELFYLIQSSLVTTLGPTKTYGERGGSFESIVVLGNFVSPLIVGLGLDVVGYPNTLFIIAGVAIVLGSIYYFESVQLALGQKTWCSNKQQDLPDWS